MPRNIFALFKINNLRADVIIGCQKNEQKQKQPVILNISYEVEISKAVASDQLEQTVDYKELATRILAKIEKTKYALIESLAKEVLDFMMKEKDVISAEVEVKKPQALAKADGVAITIAERK